MGTNWVKQRNENRHINFFPTRGVILTQTSIIAMHEDVKETPSFTPECYAGKLHLSPELKLSDLYTFLYRMELEDYTGEIVEKHRQIGGFNE